MKLQLSQALVVICYISVSQAKVKDSLQTTKSHHYHHHSDNTDFSHSEKNDVSPAVRQTGYFPNIDYLSKGYNIYKGNPLSTSGDPGFTTAIVHFEYTEGKQSTDKRFSIPDFVDAIPQQSCQLSFNSDEINGETSLTKTFQQDVSVEGGFGGAEFKASTSYKTKSEEISTKKYVYVNSKAVCSVYTASFEPFSNPQISPALSRGLKAVGAHTFADKPSIYYDLIDGFGTHHVKSIIMGAKYGQTSKLTRESASRLSQEGLTVSAGAAYSGMVSASVSSTTDQQRTQASKFDQATESKETYTIGSTPYGDSLSWSQQVFNNPAPIKYTLTRIDTFLLDYFDYSDTLPQNQHIIDGLKQALDNYCQSILLPRGDVKDCNMPSQDITALVSNQCRLCQGGCGSGFNQDGGAMIPFDNWPDWSNEFSRSCQDGTYGKQNPATRNTLCCQKDDGVTSVGECRFCLSCGGEFNYFGGKIGRSTADINLFSVYDNQCNGEQNQRSLFATEGGSLCCKGQKICSLCTSCGGYYPHETGAMGIGHETNDFFMQLPGQCRGIFYTQELAIGGVKLCCKEREVY